MTVSTTTPPADRLARIAYDAYGETTGHRNYAGLPMPAWEDLGDTIQQAWINAAEAVKVTTLKEA